MKTLNSLELISDQLELVELRMLEPDPDRHQLVNDAVTHLVKSGGKRARPIVALLVCKALDADCEQAISLAAAVEMLHTATLVHDDIIDGALFRRGIPTLNATWSPGATILTGDYLFARAADLAAQTGDVVVMQLFARALMIICNGELHQLFSGRYPLGSDNNPHQLISRETYYRRIYAKTGALFVLAAEAAGVLAGISESMLADLRIFGREMGIAFQIVDDLLDFVGSESQVGKPLGSDLAQGLVTLPAICFMEISPDDSRIQDALRGKRRDKNIQLALEAVRNSDAIRRAKQEAQEHAELAKAALQSLPDNPYRQTLLELADFIVQRKL